MVSCTQENAYFITFILISSVVVRAAGSPECLSGICSIQPLSYDVTIKVPATNNEFTASTVIHFNLLEASTRISWHSKELHSFSNVTLVSSSEQNELPLLNNNFSQDQIRFEFSRKLQKGQYLLTIGSYKGRIQNGSKGLFRRPNGLHATHFQPSEARSVMPCIDHPSIKTINRLSIIHAINTISLSNTVPNDVQIIDAKWQKTVFAPTPYLPAYLIAFSVMPDSTIQIWRYLVLQKQRLDGVWAKERYLVIGPHRRTIRGSGTFSQVQLPSLAPTSENIAFHPDHSALQFHMIRLTSFGVSVRVSGTDPAVANKVLDVASEAFEIISTMMDIPLPLNKMDFILTDNYSGGMENFAHILLSSKVAATGDEAHLIYVVAHELLHHWIGNMATVNSWQYVCLQEDLTDYLSYKIVSYMLSNKTKYDRFRLSKYVEIQLTEDFISPGHSLLLPEKIDMDSISSHCYLKGVTLLESLEAVVGETFMLSSIRNLISTHKTFDARTFATYFKGFRLDEFSTLEEVYLFWFYKGGYPTVLVDNQNATIRQTSEGPWPLRIPTTYPSISPFLFEQQMGFNVNSTLLLNANFSTFMRVNYDSETWMKVFRKMNTGTQQFSLRNRAQLISDFCYFYANDPSTHNQTIRDFVVDMVYSNSVEFDFCDWNLYWCHYAHAQSFQGIIRKLASKINDLFATDSVSSCTGGLAFLNVNKFCQQLFGTSCV